MDAHTAPESSINSDNSVPSPFMQRPATQAPSLPPTPTTGLPGLPGWCLLRMLGPLWHSCCQAQGDHIRRKLDPGCGSRLSDFVFSSPSCWLIFRPNRVVWREAGKVAAHYDTEKGINSWLADCPACDAATQRSFGTMVSLPPHRWCWLPRCVSPRGTSRTPWVPRSFFSLCVAERG